MYFLKFQKKFVILEILQKLCWNPLKMTDLKSNVKMLHNILYT